MCWSVSSATVADVADVADVVDVADVADVVDVVVVAAAAAEAVVLFYGGGITLESDVQKNEMTKEEQTPRSQLHTHTHTHMYIHSRTHTRSLTQTHTRFLLSGLVAQCHPPTSVLDYHTLTNLLWAKEVLRPTLLAQKIQPFLQIFLLSQFFKT